MNFAIDSYCLVCFLQRNIELVRPLGTEEQTTEFAKRIMQMYLDAPEGVSAPWFGPQVADLLHEMYGLPIDRFRQEKIDSNRFIMERFDHIREKVQSAPDPVLAGLQFAIQGNYLDFAALRDQVSFDHLDKMLDKAKEMALEKAVYADLCADFERGKTLLYLTDNAGEIGFDRIFAEEIAKKYPHLQITFCVRGDIANNDATREDARAVGIPFPVIDNGNRIAGTQIDRMSEQSRQALETADIVLSKGMANCETLYGCGHNIYYAFLIKCQRFVDRFAREMFTPMLVKERE